MRPLLGLAYAALVILGTPYWLIEQAWGGRAWSRVYGAWCDLCEAGQ